MAFTTIQENTWSKIGILPPININASGPKIFKVCAGLRNPDPHAAGEEQELHGLDW